MRDWKEQRFRDNKGRIGSEEVELSGEEGEDKRIRRR